MSSILKRTVVLSFSRFSSQAILLLSPILLVRILPVEEYGRYREFLVYAGLIAAFVNFGIRSSLLYLIPKYPDREPVWITQAALYTLASSTVAIILILVAGDLLRARTSFDFVTALQLYIIFYANLDFIESYWLSKKRTDNVLFYSLSHLFGRMAVVIGSAYVTEDAARIVASLVAFEFFRCVLVFFYSTWRGWFTVGLNRQSLKLQGSYFLPLGAGVVVEVVNQRAGMVFVSIIMGVEALAFFAIGAFATQVVNVFRGAIADVVFPEIVSLGHATPKDALPLWKRATVWYCILLFPMAMLFSYYADAVVTLLFTADYAAAIPVFSAFALLLCVFCFDFHLPLRVQNANRYFLYGSMLALVVNLVLIYPSYALFGLVGPAVALIVSKLVVTVYLGRWVSRIYRVNWRELADWPTIGRIALATVVCAPILIAGKFLVATFLLRSLVFGLLYLGVYLAVLQWLGVWNVSEFVSERLRSRTRAGL